MLLACYYGEAYKLGLLNKTGGSLVEWARIVVCRPQKYKMYHDDKSGRNTYAAVPHRAEI